MPWVRKWSVIVTHPYFLNNKPELNSSELYINYTQGGDSVVVGPLFVVAFIFFVLY